MAVSGKTKFDVVVAGAGIGGCLLAAKLAAAGLSVALVEKNPEKRVGFSWEAAVEKSVFSRVGLLYPPERHRLEAPELTRFYASDPSHFVDMDGSETENFHVRHCSLVEWLLEKALRAGARWLPGRAAETLELSANVVRVGVSTASDRASIRASMAVDATGIAAALRRRLPASYQVPAAIHYRDFAWGWQEVREIDAAAEKQLRGRYGMKEGLALTRLGQSQAYDVVHWRRNGTLCLIYGWAPDFGSPPGFLMAADNPASRFVRENPYLGRRIYGGGRLIPIRRALDTMVADRFLCLGDAACQVIPTMGSGVASAMLAAEHASRAVIDAFNRGDLSRGSLWAYNHAYQSVRGSVLAGYDVIRRFLQSLRLEEIDSIFRAGFLSDRDFLAVFSTQAIRYDVAQLLENAGKIFGHLELVPVGARFLSALQDSKKAMALYRNYPETPDAEGFRHWSSKADKLFRKYRTHNALIEETYL